VSPKSVYHSLEQYSLHSSSLTSSAYLNDDDLSPLTFSPPTLVPFNLLPHSEPGQQSIFERSFTYNSPFQPLGAGALFSFSTKVCRTPSPPLSTPISSDYTTRYQTRLLCVDVPLRWCSFPECETDHDLIPVDLASKKYIPDPSIIVPTISIGKSSLLLWDNNLDDCGDIPLRSPSSEEFYLDATILAEYGDEEMQKVYELTSKNEKWEKERRGTHCAWWRRDSYPDLNDF